MIVDDLDNILYNQLSHDKKLPENISNELKNIIYKSIYNERITNQTKKYSLRKIITIACAIILATTSIAYAGKVIYDKIWKSPEKTVGFYVEQPNINEKEISISKDEAQKKAEEILQKFECDNEKIITIKLEESPDDYQVDWCITTNNNTQIRFDSEGGEEFKIFFNNILNKDIKNYRTTKIEAERTAKDLCKKYGYNLDNYNSIEIYGNLGTEEESYIWYADFYKEYDGIINYYENISIGFVPEINQIYYLVVQNLPYENNPIKITDEQAKQIVLDAEKEIKVKYEIRDIYTSIDIACMNGNAYLRLNDYEQYCNQLSQNYPSKDVVEYRTDKRVRKVWKVTLNYNIPLSVDKFDINYNLIPEHYTYYVDATTGEIIGGSTIDF